MLNTIVSYSCVYLVKRLCVLCYLMPPLLLPWCSYISQKWIAQYRQPTLIIFTFVIDILLKNSKNHPKYWFFQSSITVIASRYTRDDDMIIINIFPCIILKYIFFYILQRASFLEISYLPWCITWCVPQLRGK